MNYRYVCRDCGYIAFDDRKLEDHNCPECGYSFKIYLITNNK